MAGEAFDGTVDRLLREIADIRTLLEDGGVTPGDTRGMSMRVSALQEVHNRLSSVLIEMQTALETKTDEASKKLNARIWLYYTEGANERMPTLPEITKARAKAAERIAAEKSSNA